MPIVLGGKSICRICGKVIESNQDITAFPPIISNIKDPLYMFHDAAFHSQCFQSHPLSRKMELVLDQATERTKPLRCVICGNVMHYEEDFISLGLLSSEPDSPIFPFNYFLFHRNHLKQWSELKRVHSFLAALSDDKWAGKGAEMVLAELSNAIQ